jgi:selenocysteine lyase/cysteine desulfurase
MYPTNLESYFQQFRNHIIGHDATFEGPEGRKPIIYCDWTASGRLYEPIERKMMEEFGPLVANTHTETSYTGSVMTQAYHKAREIIKKHVHAGPDDCLIAYGSGMTGVINKFQRILGLRIPEHLQDKITLSRNERPVVFVTHMEHHSNHTSWIETIGDVVRIEPDEAGLVSLASLERLLEEYKDRQVKIAAVTACSNVTGIQTPYHEIAEAMHRAKGLCFVDFACSAPYVTIDMHPANPMQYLDAIYFSPHKFLGGPGTPGVLVFNTALYHNRIPDNPGGGTVKWTNPWKEHEYIDSIEDREDGGTPPFLQTIKAALCVLVKDEMGIDNMLAREKELLHGIIFPRLKEIPGLHILAEDTEERLGVVSFYVDGLHYNQGVLLLNDRFGIQVRGGCSCAGTYGHYLLHVNQRYSHMITDEIRKGNLSLKPGWIRLSIHPTTTNEEASYVCDAIEQLCLNFRDWQNDYSYSSRTNEFTHKSGPGNERQVVEELFEMTPAAVVA